ncbi:hypothetical protein Adt_45701 [Abeliophyllum distichum]|uniref:Uncharacterized protein n=1 Tax=Abeliophyllum distichum TaxID=126358 RepID=A0ABD1PI95_9LAMI
MVESWMTLHLRLPYYVWHLLRKTTVRNVPEVMVGSPFPISMVPEMSLGVSPMPFPVGPMSSSETSGQLGKKKAAMGVGRRRPCLARVWRMGGNPRRLGMTWRVLLQRLRIAFPRIERRSQAPTSPPARRTQYINIEDCQGELDPTVLEKLPTAVAMAVTSVYRYWTPSFGKAVANADLTELLRLVELHTSWGHMLNCELYKVLAMKIEELRSMAGRGEDVDALCSENKDLQNRLAFSDDVRTRAVYDVTKASDRSRGPVWRPRGRLNYS